MFRLVRVTTRTAQRTFARDLDRQRGVVPGKNAPPGPEHVGLLHRGPPVPACVATYTRIVFFGPRIILLLAARWWRRALRLRGARRSSRTRNRCAPESIAPSHAARRCLCRE